MTTQTRKSDDLNAHVDPNALAAVELADESGLDPHVPHEIGTDVILPLMKVQLDMTGRSVLLYTADRAIDVVMEGEEDVAEIVRVTGIKPLQRRFVRLLEMDFERDDGRTVRGQTFGKVYPADCPLWPE